MKRSLLFLATGIVALAASCVPAQAQPVPRTADGKPDLTGVWQGGSNRVGTWEEANSPAAGAEFGISFQRGANAPPLPPREPPPYQPWAAKKVLEFWNRRGIDDPESHCVAPGVPRITTIGLFPMQIIQTPTTIAMLYEVFSQFRVIPLNAKHPDDLEPTYMGNSVGHWEGDTLVVDVTAFNDKTWLGPVGSFHSEDLHVVERYTRTDYNTIKYDVVVEDPKVFTKPWNIHSTIMLRNGTRLREYECEENNADMQHYEDLLKDDSIFRRK